MRGLRPIRIILASLLSGVVPSNVKIGSVGSVIDVPLGYKDDVWSFDQIDTLTATVPDALRPGEPVAIVALAGGGRARRQVGSRAAAAHRLTFWSRHDEETRLSGFAYQSEHSGNSDRAGTAR
jgi:amino acid synthesis protein